MQNVEFQAEIHHEVARLVDILIESQDQKLAAWEWEEAMESASSEQHRALFSIFRDQFVSIEPTVIVSECT